MSALADLREHLSPERLGPLLTTFGISDADRAAIEHGVRQADDGELQQVHEAAQALRARVGQWHRTAEPTFEAWPDIPGRPRGWVPLLALLATVPDVRAYHEGRGIDRATSDAALSDLRQQLMVFRQAFGEFGLDNQQWLTTAWAGGLFWLGRLQCNIIPFDGAYAISVHIPQTGPLHPAAVDDSLTRARAFFARHFPEFPARWWHCHSWLLDPQLLDVLGPDTNIAAFTRRWRLIDEPRPGDAGTVYFVFGYRPRPGAQPDYTGLPRRTSLERGVLEHLDAGRHWHTRTGLIDFPPPTDRDAATGSG